MNPRRVILLVGLAIVSCRPPAGRSVSGTVESTPSTYHAYNFGGGWNHVFRPNLILDFRAGAVLKPYQFNQASAPSGVFSSALYASST